MASLLAPPNFPVIHLYIAAIIFSLTVAMLLEAALPLFAESKAPLLRWFRNLTLSALAVCTTLLVSALFWASSRALGVTPGSGALAAMGLPIWAQWIATFILLDTITYTLHRLSHAVPWLWRLHAIHHSDIELDATTTHRHHPGESMVAALVNLPLLLILAPPVWAVLAYSITAVTVATFSHSSVALPDWLDKVLRRLIVTPAFHRVHHSANQIQTDSNYATVFSVLDFLFRSASPTVPDKGRSLTIGLETGRDPANQTLKAILLAPFRRKIALDPIGPSTTRTNSAS